MVCPGLSRLWRTICYTCNILDNLSFHPKFIHKRTVHAREDASPEGYPLFAERACGIRADQSLENELPEAE